LSKVRPIAPEPGPVLQTVREAPWLALCPPDAHVVSARSVRQLRKLPWGTVVVIAVDQPFSRWRLGHLTRRAGITVDRELIVLPSAAHPVVVVDDVEPAVRHFLTSVATVPPGVTWAPAAIMISLASTMPWHWLGALAPGRVIVGRRQ
jgi:hypothetical protein